MTTDQAVEGSTPSKGAISYSQYIMKYTISATYKNETFTFNLYDNMRWLSVLYKTGGITLGKNTVHLKYPLEYFLAYNNHIVGHEAVHVYQARHYGWKYLLTYIIQAIRANFRKRNIPMEIEAYANEHIVTWQII